MAAMQQDWRDEREEKERALALNAQLHQQVEQLQHQLEQLQQARQPRSEPFETLEPSQFTGSSSWSPEPAVRSQVSSAASTGGSKASVRAMVKLTGSPETEFLLARDPSMGCADHLFSLLFNVFSKMQRRRVNW